MREKNLAQKQLAYNQWNVDSSDADIVWIGKGQLWAVVIGNVLSIVHESFVLVPLNVVFGRVLTTQGGKV